MTFMPVMPMMAFMLVMALVTEMTLVPMMAFILIMGLVTVMAFLSIMPVLTLVAFLVVVSAAVALVTDMLVMAQMYSRVGRSAKVGSRVAVPPESGAASFETMRPGNGDTPPNQ